MKTKWAPATQPLGSSGSTLELVKKTQDCIEYLFVHEVLHPLERRHDERFFAYLKLFYPNWQLVREELN